MKYDTAIKFLNTVTILFCGIFSVYGQNTPSIKLENGSSFDFGKYPANEKKATEFIIVNEGNAPLQIKDIRKTCGCSLVKMEKKEIAPGEKVPLKIEMEPEGIFGAYSKNVYIESNDPGNHFTQISFSGEAIAAFTVKPQEMIYIGVIPSDKDFIQEFILERNLPELQPGKPELSSIIKSEAELEELGTNKYKLRIRISPGNFKDRFKITVKIPIIAASPWKPLEIIIAGQAK